MSKRQHYVSQFHLRAFADPESVKSPDPWLWVGNLNQQSVKRRSPVNFGWAREIFDFPGASENLEEFLSQEVEGPAAAALRDFFCAEPGSTSELPPEIMRYLAWAAARSLPMRTLYENWINETSKDEELKIVEPPPSGIEKIRWVDRKVNMTHPELGSRNDVGSDEFVSLRKLGWELRLGKDDFLEIIRLQTWYFQVRFFPRLKWLLLRAPAGAYFIIGDRPIVWGIQDFLDSPPSVLRSRGARLIAPLTHSLALLAHHEQDSPPVTVFPSDINRLTIAGSHEWVAGPTELSVKEAMESRTIQ